MQELESKGRIVEDVVGALRNEEAAKLAAQRDAQTSRQRVHQLEVFLLLVGPSLPSFCVFPQWLTKASSFMLF